MHSYIKIYSKSSSDDRRSLIDAIRYLGGYRYRLLARMWRQCKNEEQCDSVVNWSAFASISGRPVESMKRRYYKSE